VRGVAERGGQLEVVEEVCVAACFTRNRPGGGAIYRELGQVGAGPVEENVELREPAGQNLVGGEAPAGQNLAEQEDRGLQGKRCAIAIVRHKREARKLDTKSQMPLTKRSGSVSDAKDPDTA